MKYGFKSKKTEDELVEETFFCGIAMEDGISAPSDKMNLAKKIIRSFIGDIRKLEVTLEDIFKVLNISCRDCILLGMPIYYEKVSNRYVRDENDIYYYAHKRQTCGRKHYLDSEDSLEQVKRFWLTTGTLEINFSVYGEFANCYRLLITEHNSIFLFDGKNTEVYKIVKVKRFWEVPCLFRILLIATYGERIKGICRKRNST